VINRQHTSSLGRHRCSAQVVRFALALTTSVPNTMTMSYTKRPPRKTHAVRKDCMVISPIAARRVRQRGKRSSERRACSVSQEHGHDVERKRLFFSHDITMTCAVPLSLRGRSFNPARCVLHHCAYIYSLLAYIYMYIYQCQSHIANAPCEGTQGGETLQRVRLPGISVSSSPIHMYV
jgi:hypothetical protein